MSITTVINACSGDRNFLLEHVRAVRDVSDEIRIPYCTHLYNGKPDDLHKWHQVKELLKPYDVQMIEFPRVHGSPLGQNTAREVGSKNAKTDYVLFMDADEIFEKDKLNSWVKSFPYNDFDVISFKIYFYSLSPSLRACLGEDEAMHFVGDRSGRAYAAGERAGCLVKTKHINHKMLFTGPERWQFTSQSHFKKELLQTAMDGSIMLHHYAYVRDESEMRRKVSTYAHANDKSWAQWIDRYFHPNFKFDNTKDRDICHGYILKDTVPPHEILSLNDFDKKYLES